MTQRWVIDGMNGFLNACVASIRWADERERLNYQGSVIGRENDMGTQLRWMVLPRIGLPANPFIVWRGIDPGGNLSKQELANLPDWQPIEIVGLPVDETWADTPYSLDRQGPHDALVEPFEAAMDRLKRGAPPIGWTRLEINGLALPDWQPPDPASYLKFVMRNRIVQGVHRMLATVPAALDHDAFVDQELPRVDQAILPRLILDPNRGPMGIDQPSSSEWHPMRVLAISASSDPYAALALGFGTSLIGFEGGANTLLMVSVRHRLTPDGPDFELADIVRPFQPIPAPGPPRGLSTRLVSRTRPQSIDAPGLDSIGVAWMREPNPAFAAGSPLAAYPASYAIGRFGIETWRDELLLTPYPSEVGGWKPYVPGRGTGTEPAMFVHHLSRATTVGHPPVIVPAVTGGTITYAVAAQDLFGRWSSWATVNFQTVNESPQSPSIVSSLLKPDGRLTIDFCWDWTDRSPQFMELFGAFADDPGNRLLSIRCNFAGQPEPTPAVPQVQPLNQQLETIPGWGEAQDKDPNEPGVRYYRLTTIVPMSFNGQPWRDFQTQARGQCHVHQLAIPGFNVSPFGPPSITRVFDPAPPPPPKVPEVPQWASLPDAHGTSRIVLTWNGVPTAKGYAVYEATETALLSAIQANRPELGPQPGPNTAESFTTRLEHLRNLPLQTQRAAFRRLRPDLIPAGSVRYEAALPRGSRVLHIYAVTAFSENGVESPWPDQSKKFIAVASPRLDIPEPPVIEAQPRTDGGSGVSLRIETHRAAGSGQVEVYRTTSDTLAQDLNLMGPPVATINISGPIMLFTDSEASSGWRRFWYRAVVWSATDNLNGFVEARSEASAAAAIFLPPAVGPSITDVRVNLPRSTTSYSLVSWTLNAPAPHTPMGSHSAVLESRNAAGDVRVRLDQITDITNEASVPGPVVGSQRIFRVMGADRPRYYGWVLRPDTPQSFPVRLKVIDPLGRIGASDVSVPPLPLDPPVITSFSPENGRAGDTVEILGQHLVLQDGDPVVVRFDISDQPDEPVDPGPFVVIGQTTSNQILVTIPDVSAHEDSVRLRIRLVRSDGKEAVSPAEFFLAIL